MTAEQCSTPWENLAGAEPHTLLSVHFKARSLGLSSVRYNVAKCIRSGMKSRNLLCKLLSFLQSFPLFSKWVLFLQ